MCSSDLVVEEARRPSATTHYQIFLAAKTAQCVALDAAKRLLTAFSEDNADARALVFLNQFVEVDKAHTRGNRQRASERRLAAAHVADEEYWFHIFANVAKIRDM